MTDDQTQKTSDLLTKMFGWHNWFPNRPVSSLSDVQIKNQLLKLKSKVLTSTTATNASPAGAPQQLVTLSVTQAPSKQQDRTFSEVFVSFTRNSSDTAFDHVNVWFKGYKGNPNPVLMTSGSESPISFLCEATQETVVVYAQPVSINGVPAALSGALSASLLLSGVVSAPPAPSISQSLIGTTLGYQFSFNQVVLPAGTQDVIDSYKVYRNTTNSSGSATVIQTFKHDQTNLGSAIVVTDTVVPASGAFYYYWVSAVNTQGLESVLTAAQSGTVVGSIGSVPPSLSATFTYVSTGTPPAITWAWPAQQAVFRADGTVTTIGSGTQAITGLAVSNTYYFYPYWRESDQTLQWLSPSDVTLPNITGVTFNGTTQMVTTANSVNSLPAQFTIEAWIKSTSATVQTIVSLEAPQTGTGAVTNQDMELIVTSTGEIKFQYVVVGTVTTVTTSGAGVLDGAWHHIVVTFATGGTITIYVDTVSKGTGAALGAPRNAGIAIWYHIGYAGANAAWATTSNSFWNGSLSHVALYPTVLTSTQLTTHFQSMVNLSSSAYDTAVTTDGPTYNWKLTDTSGTTAVDSAGTNTGTYQNTPTLNQSSAAITVVGTPQIAWPFTSFIASQGQNLRNKVPLSSGSMQAATPAAGGGGGGGGGGTGGGDKGGGCFSGNTLVRTHRGIVAIQDIYVGDYVLTAAGTWRPVIKVLEHEASSRTMCDMGADELITLPHTILDTDSWVPASTLFESRVIYEKSVFNLSVGARTPDPLSPNTENSFTLANGRVVHNVLK